MGAGISLAFALRYPQRVKALILNRPAWLDAPNPPNLSILTVIGRLVERFGLERAGSEFEQTEPYQDLERSCPGSAKSLTDLFMNQNTDALVASLRAIPASAPVDSLDRLPLLASRHWCSGIETIPRTHSSLRRPWPRQFPGPDSMSFRPSRKT